MPVKKDMIKRFAHCSVVALGLLASGFALSACDISQNQLKTDRGANMEFQDYRDGLAPRMQHVQAEDDSEIPSFQPYIAQPSESLKPMPLVSISVNQTIPLRDVLFELAGKANYDIELDPRISGSIIFTAREKPFDLVIERIADIAGLRYKFEDDVVRVELDTPYLKTYKVDYLAYIRKNTSSIRNDVAVVTGQGTNTGSAFSAEGESEIDFWGELVDNMTQILGVPPTVGALKTSSTPQITAAAQNPAPVQAVVSEGTAGEGGEGGEAAPTVEVAAPQATLNVTSLPTVDDTGLDPMAASAGGAASPLKASFSVNRQGGMVSVFSTEKQHKEVELFLNQLKRSVTAQVLIEAKILEVTLTDQFSTGIDWNELQLSGKGALDILLPAQAFDPVLNPNNTAIQLAVGGNDVNALITAVSRFGTVRALASPRLTVLNNQSAVLNVAENFVYFELDIDVTRDQFGTQTEVDSEIRNVPDGVLINVQPSINLDERTVSMAVRPTITSIDPNQSVNDPAVAIVAASLGGAGANIQSAVPVVNIQEFDSVISMDSGQAIVMGGLMKDRSSTNEQGVPILKEVPVFGSLFKAHRDSVEKTELVVFLKATIIDGSNIHNTDRELYKTFSGDRRPLDL